MRSKNLFTLLFSGLLSLLAPQASAQSDLGAIILNTRQDITLLPGHEMQEDYYLQLLILNNEGLNHAKLSISYNALTKIDDIRLYIKDIDGNIIRRITRRSAEDILDYRGYFHTHDREMIFTAYHDEFPYIVELSYTASRQDYINLPYFFPMLFGNLPVVHASYTLNADQPLTLYTRFNKMSPDTTFKKTDKGYQWSWKVDSIPAVKKHEALMPLWYNTYPYGLITNRHWKLGEYEADVDSWEDLGYLYAMYIRGLDTLPPETANKVHQLTDSLPDDHAKARVLYDLLRTTTRYVCVITDMGHLPYDATYVATNGYGDCKALSNYMKALLLEAGIPSYYCAIRAGKLEGSIDTTLVYDPFNHIVLMVPFSSDTVWLECTAPELPFGYWGTFCNDRPALVCDSSFSGLVMTPALSHEENSTTTVAEVRINQKDLDISWHRTLRGDAMESILLRTDPEDSIMVQRMAEKFLPFDHPIIDNYGLLKDYSHEIAVREKADFKLLSRVSKIGNLLMIEALTEPDPVKGILNSERTHDLYVPINKMIRDSIFYETPAGYQPVRPPDNILIKNEFGSFQLEFIIKDTGIMAVSTIQFNKGTWPPDEATSYLIFLNTIHKNDHYKIYFEKKKAPVASGS